MTATDKPKWAIITGAGSGMGRSFAEKFLAEKWGVLAMNFSREALDALQQAHAGEDVSLVTAPLDIVDRAAVADAIDGSGIGDWLYAAVTAAGIYPPSNLSYFTAEQFNRIMNVNVLGTLNVAAEAIRHMRTAKTKGAIVTISSADAFTASTGQLIYSASKAAVVSDRLLPNRHCRSPEPNRAQPSEAPGRRSQGGRWREALPVGRDRSHIQVRLRRGAREGGSPDGRRLLWRLIAAVPYKVHTVLTDNGTHFTTPGNTGSAAPDIRAAIDARELFWAHAFEYACAENDIDHRLTRPKQPWTNGQVERTNRTIKDPTVKRFYCETHDRLRTHLADFVTAFDFARRLKPSRSSRHTNTSGSIGQKSRNV